MAAFEPGSKGAKRYKLFTEPTTREVVLDRLVAQLSDDLSIRESPTVQLCLVAGKIPASGADKLQDHFNANGWLLFDQNWLHKQLIEVASDGYDNTVASVTAKLLLRGQ